MNELRSSGLVWAPAEMVFGIVDRWEHLGEIHSRLRLEPVEDAPTQGLGARFRGRYVLSRLPAVVYEGDFEVTEHYFPERFSLQLEQDLRWQWTFGRVGDQTLVELRFGYRLPGGLIGRIVGSGLGALVRGDVDAAIADLGRLAGAEPG